MRCPLWLVEKAVDLTLKIPASQETPQALQLDLMRILYSSTLYFLL